MANRCPDIPCQAEQVETKIQVGVMAEEIKGMAEDIKDTAGDIKNVVTEMREFMGSVQGTFSNMNAELKVHTQMFDEGSRRFGEVSKDINGIDGRVRSNENDIAVLKANRRASDKMKWYTTSPQRLIIFTGSGGVGLLLIKILELYLKTKLG